MTERPKSSREPAAREPIVFVVEDDESVRRALTNLFQSVGLEVELFGSAPEMLENKLPDVASCLVALATPFGKLAKDAEAEKLLQRAIAIDEKALGRDHPDVAWPLSSLAWVRWNQGRYAEAQKTLSRSLRISEMKLEPGHVTIGDSIEIHATLS